MVKDIIKDLNELSKKCIKCNKEDEQLISKIIRDLIDTGKYYVEETEIGCVGLAANQIGYNKRIIIVNAKNDIWIPFINPVITNHSRSTHKSEEGCLSIEGTRETFRYDTIEIMFRNSNNFNKIERKVFKGGTATILQHEIDHLNGILI